MDFSTTYDKETKIWSGPSIVPYYDFNCSIGLVIYEQMKNMPKKVCQISDIDNRKVTNEEGLRWSIRIAQHLNELNMKHTDCVGIIGKNTTYVMAVAYGCFMNTTPFHAVNPAHEEAIISYLFSLTKPKIIFCDGVVYERVNNATKAWQPLIYTLEEHLENVKHVEELLTATNEERHYYPKVLVEGGTQTVAILCSSGTTGLPKAVQLQNKDLFYNCRINSDDVLFSLSGVDWISGLSTLVISATKCCTRIITNKPFTPEYFADLVFRHQITYFATPPRVIAMLLAKLDVIGDKLKSLRLVLCGGGYFTTHMIKSLQGLINAAGQVTQIYALTEFGLVTSNYTYKKSTSPGFLSAGLRARIVNDDGAFMGPNESGEILLDIGRPWTGYYKNAAATADVKTADNWLHTGDIGYFDDEGYLFIIDRKKETMKNNGFHYWPTEIENIIAELPGVIESCVVGIYDELIGHVPAALVRKLPNSSLTIDDIKQHVAKRCPAYKHLSAGVVFADVFPQNKNGKVLRKEATVLFEQLAAAKA